MSSNVSAFEPAIIEYLQDLRVAKRYSPHTVSNYQRDLKAFAAAALERSIDGWGEVTTRDIRSIVAEQHLAGISGRSLARKLSALRGLYTYMMKLPPKLTLERAAWRNSKNCLPRQNHGLKAVL